MTRVPRYLALGVLATGLALAGACNIIGPAFVLIHGPEKLPQAYTLDPKRPTVIFIDDRSNVLSRRSLRQAIAEAAQKQLLAQHASENIIDCRSALAAAARDKFGQPMSIVEIARAVQADVVVYATIESFSFSEDGQTMSPVASAWVKVIDATTETRLWPEEKTGQRIAIHPKFEQGFAPQSQADLAKAENQIAERLGTAISQLFYEHELNQSELRK